MIVAVLLACLEIVSGAYCTSGPVSTADSNLGAVYLQNIAETSDCPGQIGVQDFTALVATLISGTNYLLTYNITKCGSIQYQVLSGAWIDFNQDQIFAADESLFPFSTIFGIQTKGFVVPSDALLGQTVMRVQVQETSQSLLNPCLNFGYGGTKDFGILIQGGSYCSSGPSISADTAEGPVALLGTGSIITENSGCPGALGVQNLTNLVADLIMGKSYTLNTSIITCGGEYPILGAAWIDYNRNFLFESSEQIGSYIRTYGATSTRFTVPYTNGGSAIKAGPTRLRVQVQETSFSSLNPCAGFSYGGTKDFAINLWDNSSYCPTGPLQLEDTAQGPVALRGETFTIIEDSACPGAIGVQDFTDLAADLIIGKSYTLNSTILTCAEKFPVVGAAWIDYNRNNKFEDNERITPFAYSYTTTSIAFKISPSLSLAGLTRLRVQVQESFLTTIDPCALFDYGGTKDFTVNLRTA